VIIIGHASVGKSFWCKSIVGADTSNIKPTFGVEVYMHEWNGIKLELWDTSGNVCAGIRNAYFLNVKRAIIVYKDKASVDTYKREIIQLVGKKIPFVAFKT
jgi:GTPase SAR1 family protein